MITTHYFSFPASVDWHVVVDDFGNLCRPGEDNGIRPTTWAAAYRFANGQTFEQAGMHSIGALVAEH